jgi:type IV secretion system protein VirD4
MIWRGVPLGYDRAGRPISYNESSDGSGNAPTLVFGPPGSFKTVGLVVPQLLDEESRRRSFVVIDPKGEITAITSRFRRRVSDVKIINPYGLLVDERPDMRSDGWNPLGDLNPASPGFIDDCQGKGAALIKTDSNESQKHFPDSARSGMTATIAWVVSEVMARRAPGPPLLATVRNILTLPADRLRPVIQRMVDSGGFDISSRAAKFLADNTEIQNIKSTIETNTTWMSPPMRRDMETSRGVNFRDLSRRPTTVYVIIPTEELAEKSTYLRLVLSSALRALYCHGGVPTTLIIEEGFVLGHHAEIEQALSILRGFCSRMTIVFQSLSQIKKLYPDTWGLFTAGAVLAFRPADTDTARWLVEKAGKVTMPVLSASEPRPGESVPGMSWQQRERDRIPEPKMFAMPRARALVWLPHEEAPRVSWVKGYFEIPGLARRASANPYHGVSVLRRSRRRL